MTLITFRTLYPEFRPTADAQIEAVMAQCELVVADTWGAERDEIIGLETASRLAAGPQGRAANLQAKDGTSCYSRALLRRQEAHTCGLMRVGGLA